ncbi:Voltage-gated potassium channel subunit beta, partial [Globisporangium splendens]
MSRVSFSPHHLHFRLSLHDGDSSTSDARHEVLLLGQLGSSRIHALVRCDGVRRQAQRRHAYDMMVKGFQGGVNCFDNAEVYGIGKSETIMDEIIKKGVKNGPRAQHQDVLWHEDQPGGPSDQGLSRKHIIEGVKASLKRLDSTATRSSIYQSRLVGANALN